MSDRWFRKESQNALGTESGKGVSREGLIGGMTELKRRTNNNVANETVSTYSREAKEA